MHGLGWRMEHAKAINCIFPVNPPSYPMESYLISDHDHAEQEEEKENIFFWVQVQVRELVCTSLVACMMFLSFGSATIVVGICWLYPNVVTKVQIYSLVPVLY